MEEEILCAKCNTVVVDEQSSLECKSCRQLQHHTCSVEITPFHIHTGGEVINLPEWRCDQCQESQEGLTSPIQNVIIETMDVSTDQETNHVLQESSCSDPSNGQDSLLSNADDTTYEVLAGASNKGKDKLYDSKGFTYTLQKVNRSGSKLWRCHIRNKKNLCHAAVLQSASGSFQKGSREHNHLPIHGALTNAKIAAKTKLEAAKRVSDAAPAIVLEVLQELLPLGEPSAAVRSVKSLVRNANYHRKNNGLKQPSSAGTEFAVEEVPPGFLRKDIQLDGARHLIFATDEQVSLLKAAKTWHIDPSFKVSERPYTQIFSVHAFVKTDGKLKMISLLFSLMSRRKKEDYVAVLRGILEILDSVPKVKSAVMEYEKTIWKAMRHILPTVALRGCPFHYTQAVFNRISAEGLKKDFQKRGAAQKLMRRLISLCYIPDVAIVPAFHRLEKKLKSKPNLKSLFRYVRKYWVCGKNWTPVNWSVYNIAIRTNKDLEVYHRRFNRTGRRRLSFHTLCQILHSQASFAGSELTLLSEGKL